jgi:hypothetical protein
VSFGSDAWSTIPGGAALGDTKEVAGETLDAHHAVPMLSGLGGRIATSPYVVV